MSSPDNFVPYSASNGREIIINLANDQLLDHFAYTTVRKEYLTGMEASPQEAFARACCAFSDDNDHAQRLYGYITKRWFGFASPLLSNGGTDKGLPISCFLNTVTDSCVGLAQHHVESSMLSVMGGGIGGYWGNVRSIGTPTSRGGETSGLIPFLKWTEGMIMAFKQGRHRRGAYAAYLDISHPEIVEFINLRKPAGGDPNRKALQLHHAVNITDKFMEAVSANQDWDLVDPHTKKVVEKVSARSLFRQLLEVRLETGEPYLHFVDTANKLLNPQQKLMGLTIKQSNLCSEIELVTDEQRTAVCCLSSINVETFDQWKDDPLFIEDMVRMLDNALQTFIDKAPPELHKAVYSATRERSLGLGQMGFHYYLQSKGIPFESAVAVGQSRRISELIYTKAVEASKKLAMEKGEPEDLKGSGMRNAHIIALAPTAKNSIISMTSPSIEPLAANVFVQKTTSGSFRVENKYLKLLLQKYDKDTDEMWAYINEYDGSVQHLNFLTKDEKDVFKTSIELDQQWIIEHAAIRQPFIDQGQSINLFFRPDVHIKTLMSVHINAWKKGLKALYYCRSEAYGRAEKMKENVEVESKLGNEIPEGEDGCLSCGG